MPARKKKDLSNSELEQLVQDVHMHGINVHSREIYLNGHSGDNESDPEIDFRVATNFIKNIHLLERLGRSTITVHMNIGGGSWEYGMAMFDAIQAASSPVNIIAYSLASSMSGVLLQAAKKRIMMPHTHFMLHYGSISFDGVPSTTASEMVRFNDREGEVMLDIFAQRAVNGQFFADKKWNYKKVKDYIDARMRKTGDWIMSSSEAIDFGFADEIWSKK